MMHFLNFNGVISQVVVDDVWTVLSFSIESQYFSVIVQELFLGNYSPSSQLLLQEFLHLGVFLCNRFDK
jgi:hypothetical protein